MPSDRRVYLAISAIYVTSRILLYALGVRFVVEYGWQHFHDLDLLEHRLWESLLYSHAFPPFMNLLVGIVLKLSPAHAPAIYQALFLVTGLGFALSMAYLMRALALGRGLTIGLVALFMLSPPFIYLENLLHYEFPAAALLTLSAVLLHRALVSGRGLCWFAFFLDCALIAYTRLTFHLVWVAAAIALALLFDRKRARTILASALVPLLLVTALYAKNVPLFGFFGASSRVGFTLALMTTKQLTKAERRAWLAQGKLHPASLRSVYSGADEYARYVDLSHKTGIPVLDRIYRADGQPNFNHWALIEISNLLLSDGRTYLRERPWDYARNAWLGRIEYLSPTTRWHPKDPLGSPHRANRARLERYENLYNAALHEFPIAPYGLYLFLLPLCLAGVGFALVALWRSRLAGCEREKLVLFMALNCAYVPLISCLATHGELARYRFLVEAFLLIVPAFTVARAIAWWRTVTAARSA